MHFHVVYVISVFRSLCGEKSFSKGVLNSDGSADVEEMRDIDLMPDDVKTEWYVNHKNIDCMEIGYLKVVGYVSWECGNDNTRH